VNGKVLTMDNTGTVVGAVVVRDGKFVAAGSDAEIRGLADKSSGVVDLEGKTVMPGIISKGVAHLPGVACA
jgi:predicted amidohydrolase YtcJ